MDKQNLTAAAAALKRTAHRLQSLTVLADFKVLLDAPAIARSLIAETHQSLSALYASTHQLELALAPIEEQKGEPCPANATTTASPEEHCRDSAPALCGSNPTTALPLKSKAKAPVKRDSRRSG